MEIAKEDLARCSIGDEDDAQTSNTCIVQRKRTISHSTAKNYRNVIACCKNTHQGAACTGKQTCTCTLDLGVTLLVPFSGSVQIRSCLIVIGCVAADDDKDVLEKGLSQLLCSVISVVVFQF